MTVVDGWGVEAIVSASQSWAELVFCRACRWYSSAIVMTPLTMRNECSRWPSACVEMAWTPRSISTLRGRRQKVGPTTWRTTTTSKAGTGRPRLFTQRALAIREKALGPEHPDVATSLNNLGALYYAQGQYEKAEPLYQRALAIREKALGPEHPGVATCLKNYALLLRNTDRPQEAAALESRARAIRAKHA
jgi:tetratricopeptide (TPR) repeat protein